MTNILVLDDIQAEVDDILTEAAQLVTPAPVLRPIEPAVAVAHLIGSPVRVLNVVNLALTDSFVWVQYEPYGNVDPLALAPAYDFGVKFEAALGCIIRAFADKPHSNSSIVRFQEWYTTVSTRINALVRYLAQVPLEQFERDLVYDILSQWAADPNSLDKLIHSTTLDIEPAPVAAQPIEPAPVAVPIPRLEDFLIMM